MYAIYDCNRKKTTVQFEAVCEPKFMSFWDYVADPLYSLQRTCPLMYIVFRSTDIGR